MCQGHLSVYLVFGRVGSREGQLKKHLNMWDKICSSNYAQESRRGYGGTWYKQTNFLTFRNVFHYRFFEGEKFWDENAMMQFVLNLYMRDLVLPEDQKKKAQSLRKLLRLVSFLMDVCFLIFFFLVNNSSWWYSLLIFFLVSQPTKLGAFGKYLVFFFNLACSNVQSVSCCMWLWNGFWVGDRAAEKRGPRAKSEIYFVHKISIT